MSTTPVTPDASSTPPPAQPPASAQASNPQDQASWAQAANPAQNPVQTQDASSTAKISPQDQPDYTPPPVVVTSQKPGGIMGVIHGVVDALVGKATPEIGTDQQGNKYVKQVSLTHGQQWARIGSEALQGAAAGLAAGKGAGNQGAAAEAGVQAGQKVAGQQQQQQQQMSDEARKENLSNANNQMLRMQMAESAWKATRMQTEASQHDVEFAQGQVDRLVKEGGTILGTAAHPGDISGILKVNPDVMKDMIQKHQIEIMPNINPDGTRGGITVVKMPDGYRNTIQPAGAVFHTFDQTTGQYVEHKSADPIRQGDIDDYEHAAGIAAQKFATDKQEQDLKASQTAEARANASKVPSEIAKNNAEANKSNATAATVRAGMTNEDGTPNPRFEALAQALYDGDILPKDLKREAKGAGLDPNALEGRAVEIGKANGKPWSASIIEQEQHFASNTKTQAALDGIDRVIGTPQTPGYMDQMLNAAHQANLKSNGLYNSSALAVKRTFGDTAAKNFETAVSETRRSIAGLIGNPLLGGSDSDKKLQQADEMLGQSPTIQNLTGAAGILKQALQTSKQSLIGNNRFLQRRYGGASEAPPQQQPAAQTVQPPALPPTAPPPAQGMSRIWAPGSPTWKDVPTAQVPKNIPGLVVRQ